MESARSIGRVIGVLFLVQAILAILVSTRWIVPVRGPGFLQTAAGSARQINVAVLVSFLMNGITLAIAIFALPLFRRHSERMAFTFLVLSVIGFLTLAVDSLAVRDMLYLSQQYSRAGAATALIETLGGMARATWLSAHYTMEILVHVTYCALYVLLYRSALVPRALAAIGIAATVVSTAAVMMPFLGYPFVPQLVMPMVVTQLALTAWLLVRGLEERLAR